MRVRKRVGRRLTEDQELVLTEGPGVISFTTVEEIFGSLETVRAAWLIHGARIEAEYAESRPGYKPWGWWEFTATEAEKATQRVAEAALQRERELRARTPSIDLADLVVPDTKKVQLPYTVSNGHVSISPPVNGDG